MARRKKLGIYAEDALNKCDTDLVQIAKSVKNQDELHCPLNGCLFSCKDKKQLNRHLSTCKQLDHLEYKQRIKTLKEKYKNSDEYENIGCEENRCCQCNRSSSCLRKECELFMKLKRRYDIDKRNEQKKQLQEQSLVLFDWFYNKTNTNSLNPHNDIHKLTALLKSGIDFVSIVNGLELLVDSGETNLQYLGKCIIERANKYVQYRKQINIVGTMPYFVNYYYQSFCKHISNYLLGKDTEKLLLIKKSFKLTNDQIHMIIDYMIQRHIDSFNYIDRIVPKVLLLNNLRERQMPKNEDYMQSVINELLAAKTTVDEIQHTYDTNFTSNVIQKVKQILLSDSFNQKFLAIEWLFLIKFPLDRESYEFAKNNAKKHNRQANFHGIQYQEYCSWFKEQLRLFEQ